MKTPKALLLALCALAALSCAKQEGNRFYKLSNKSGMEVTVTNFGGRITSIVLPDKDGVKREPNILEKSDLLAWLQVRATTGRGGGPTPEPPAPRPCCSRRASLPRGGGAPGPFPGHPLLQRVARGRKLLFCPWQ